MQKQICELNFEGQKVFVGIDVHLKSWTVTLLTEKLFHKTFTQPPNAEVLHNYLVKNFPGGEYHSVYEAGFSGFWTHYKLKELGINNIVINPADVPTSQKEQLQKDDPTDSRKLARSLRSGDLNSIYIPEPATLEDARKRRIQKLCGFYPVILSEINAIQVADENPDECFGVVRQYKLGSFISADCQSLFSM